MEIAKANITYSGACIARWSSPDGNKHDGKLRVVCPLCIQL